MKLLISGSRKSTEEALVYVNKVVRRADTLGWEIIVGDAEGVDLQVVLTCRVLEVPYHTYGITDFHRTATVDNDHYTKVNGDYLARDRFVCDIADRGIFIWNGTSRGTKYTYDYMVKSGKPADLRVFKAVRDGR